MLLGDFDFATERHLALVEALGLPVAAVGWGYRYLARRYADPKPPVIELNG